MNLCILTGVIIDVYEFKFIYDKAINHKCIVKFKINTGNNQVFEVFVLDEMIEEVIKNKFKYVHICAKFVEKCNLLLEELCHWSREILTIEKHVEIRRTKKLANKASMNYNVTHGANIQIKFCILALFFNKFYSGISAKISGRYSL